MAIAKLSASLLAYKDAPNNPSVDLAPANLAETPQWALLTSDSAIVSVSEERGSVAEGAALASSGGDRNPRYSRIFRIGTAICGIAAVAAIGIALLVHRAEHGDPIIVLQSPVAPSASKPGAAASALELPAELVPATSNPAILESVGSPVQQATTNAAVSAASVQPTAIAPVPTQSEPVIATIVSEPAAPTTATHLSAREVAALLTRGDSLLRNGDIVSARLCYERAAENGDAQGALRLGETYDPAFIARAQVNGARSDAVAAARWYRQALELGAAEAQVLLTGVADNASASQKSKDLNQQFEQFLSRHAVQRR